MEKEMLDLKFYKSDVRYICIQQPSVFEENKAIVIHPEQVDTWIKWLKEAKEE